MDLLDMNEAGAEEVKAGPVKKAPVRKTKKKRRKRDGEKKKRGATAYFVFLEAFRPEFKKANPESKGVLEISKAAGAKWNSLPDGEKEQYKSVAEQRNKENGIVPKSEQPKPKPTKPKTAWMMFLSVFRIDYKQDNPECKMVTEVTRAAGARWKMLSDEDKKGWEERSHKEFAEMKEAEAAETAEAVETAAGL